MHVRASRNIARVQSLRNIRASSLQEDAEDDAAMILDTTSAAISRERLIPADR